MKKMIMIAVVAVMLVSCGGGSTEAPVTTDTCKVDNCGTTTSTTTTVVDTIKTAK